MEFEPTIQLVDCPECGSLAAAAIPGDQIMVVVSPIPYLNMGEEMGPLEKEDVQTCTCSEGHTIYIYSRRSGIITL